MLSEFEIIVNTSGVTIISPYLYTPRFIPFDQKGRCKTCKSDNVEIDYVIQPEGITIFCSRLKKEKFVPFDKTAIFNQNDVDDKNRTVRIRSRSKSYNIPISLSRYPSKLESRIPSLTGVEERNSSLVLLNEKHANVKNESDIPLNISDIPLPSLEMRENISLNTQSPMDVNISLPTQTNISSQIPHGSLEPPLPSPTLINPTDSTTVMDVTTLSPLSVVRTALSPLSVVRTAHSPSPVISPISFFPDL